MRGTASVSVRRNRLSLSFDGPTNSHYVMTMKNGHRSIPAGQFKSHCLAILDRVAEKRESVVVTKRGRPVARVVPLEGGAPKSMLGSVRERGDIVGSLDERWDAEA